MPVKTLPPNTYTVVRSYVPWSKRFKYQVEAERPVDTYVLDEDELAKFKKGKRVRSYGGYEERRFHRDIGRLPREGEWYLVISNFGEEPSAVYYEVSNPL